MLGVDNASHADDRALLGQLLETFVFQELRRQASWQDAPMAFYHFRDKDGAEVDIVVERGLSIRCWNRGQGGSNSNPGRFSRIAQTGGNGRAMRDRVDIDLRTVASPLRRSIRRARHFTGGGRTGVTRVSR